MLALHTPTPEDSIYQVALARQGDNFNITQRWNGPSSNGIFLDTQNRRIRHGTSRYAAPTSPNAILEEITESATTAEDAGVPGSTIGRISSSTPGVMGEGGEILIRMMALPRRGTKLIYND